MSYGGTAIELCEYLRSFKYKIYLNNLLKQGADNNTVVRYKGRISVKIKLYI